MQKYLFAATLLIAASGCGPDDTVNVSPDPVGSGTSDGSGGSGGDVGVGGNGAGGGSGGFGGDGSGGSGASDSVPEAQAGFVSGSRLKARYREGPDGSREYIGFYDTVNQANCEYLGTSINGERRCFPSAKSDTVYNSGNYFFGDPNCTSKAILADRHSEFTPNTQFASVLANNSAGNDRPLWRQFYAWTVVSVSYVPQTYNKLQGCQPYNYPGFAVNGPADETQWVLATEGVEP